MKAHKHAAVIKAWAEGSAIEWRFGESEEWRPLNNNEPRFDEMLQYRVKPAQPRMEITNGGALNEAGWLIIENLPAPVPGHIFNNIKMPLKAAIELWLEKQTEFDLQDRAARDLAIAEAVREACVTAATPIAGYPQAYQALNGIDLQGIIAKVQA
jgi:hypothetical protein